MNRKAFEERLKEIKMSEYDAKLYGQFLRAVQPQVCLMEYFSNNILEKSKFLVLYISNRRDL